MKKTTLLYYIFLTIFPLTLMSSAHDTDNDTQHIMQLAERRAQQVAALSQTGIFELDSANNMYKASPFLLGDNYMRLVFAEPVLVSIIKVIYESMSCVERIEWNGKLRESVKEITLKLTSDAYKKAVYYAQLTRNKAAQEQEIIPAARALRNNFSQKQQQYKNRLLQCLNWFYR